MVISQNSEGPKTNQSTNDSAGSLATGSHVRVRLETGPFKLYMLTEEQARSERDAQKREQVFFFLSSLPSLGKRLSTRRRDYSTCLAAAAGRVASGGRHGDP